MAWSCTKDVQQFFNFLALWKDALRAVTQVHEKGMCGYLEDKSLSKYEGNNEQLEHILALSRSCSSSSSLLQTAPFEPMRRMDKKSCQDMYTCRVLWGTTCYLSDSNKHPGIRQLLG